MRFKTATFKLIKTISASNGIAKETDEFFISWPKALHKVAKKRWPRSRGTRFA